jgi:tryptophanyl-tRNA synthetase
MAERFNSTYGSGEEIIRLPSFRVQKEVATVSGIDGRKMSKSYDNALPLFAPAKRLQKLVNRILSDSTPVDAPKDPATSIVFEIYSQFGSPEQIEDLRKQYAAGISWGLAKAALFELLESCFGEQRKYYEELMADRERMDRILAEGAEKARAIARPRLAHLRDVIGIAGAR